MENKYDEALTHILTDTFEPGGSIEDFKEYLQKHSEYIKTLQVACNMAFVSDSVLLNSKKADAFDLAARKHLKWINFEYSKDCEEYNCCISSEDELTEEEYALIKECLNGSNDES